MAISGRSQGDQMSQEFRNRMEEYYRYSEAVKQQLISQPYMYRTNREIAAAQKALKAELARTEKAAAKQVSSMLAQSYKLGLESSTGKPYKGTMKDLRVLLGERYSEDDPFAGLQDRFERDFISSLAQTRRSIETEVPKNWRFSNAEVAKSRGVKDAARRIQAKRKWATNKGYLTAQRTKSTRLVRETGKVASEGLNAKKMDLDFLGDLTEKQTEVRWRFDSYMNLLAKRNAQAAYNRGVIEGGKRNKVQTFRIDDGPKCGLRFHDDKPVANGMHVNYNDARRYALSHPNCVRTFQPMPGVPEPPNVTDKEGAGAQEIRSNQRTRVSKAYKEYARLYARVLAVSGREFTLNMAKDTANFLVSDLVNDQMFRRQTIDRIVRNHPKLSEIDRRAGRVVQAIQQKAGLLGRIPPTDHDVFDAAEYWANRYAEDPSVAMPAWARRILFRESTVERIGQTQLKKVVGGEDLHDLSWWDIYRDTKHRSGLTHNQLNVMNSIQQSYGERFFNSLAGNFFDNVGAIPEQAMRFQRMYAPSSKLAEKSARRVGQALQNEIYQRTLKRPADKIFETIFPDIDALGKVRVVRTSNKILDMKHMGLRYDWDTRPIKVQTTLVNRYKFMIDQELRKAAESSGLSVSEPYQAKAFGKYMYDSVRYRSRKEIIDELGYNAGLLTRITIKPHELVRLGFRFDPGMGWRRPLPQLSVSTPAVKGVRLNTVLRMNRGFKADNPFMSNYAPYKKFLTTMADLRATGPRPRPQVTQAESTSVDGVRLRTVTQEINIAFGGLMNLNKYIKIAGPARYIVPRLPYISQVGMRAGTFVGRMESMADAKWYLKNVGVKGFYEDMAIISWFAEMRALGFGWFSFPKMIGIKHEDIPKLAQAFSKVWNGYRAEAGLATLLARAHAVRYTPGANIDNIAAYIERYMKIYDAQYPDVDSVTRQREIRKIRNLIMKGGDV